MGLPPRVPRAVGRAGERLHRRREYERRIEVVPEASGVAAGEFRDLDPRRTSPAWLGMHGCAYLWLNAGGPLWAADVAGRFADIFVLGVASPALRRRTRRSPSDSSSAL